MSIARADANPTKSFFVRMLTRDISLDDCILDLVDNSIDGAWEQSGDRPRLERSTRLQQYWVAVEIQKDHFVIEDNCGGITLDEAEHYAFTFGRRDLAAATEHFSVGVYGIGMKRAIFKIGNVTRILSTYSANDDIESFAVPINVEEWLADDSTAWDFPIEAAEPLGETGVRIESDYLSPEAASRFSNPAYVKSLRRTLARDYLLPLMHGLTISVNDVDVEYQPLELRHGGEFAPLRDKYTDDGVTVEILAGMASPPPEGNSPEEIEKEGPASGWYLLCNGRVIVAADTSALTGWGLDIPRWHGQYSGFLGMVLFTAENAALLPMTTTKRGVDVSSAVYLHARERMMRAGREWIDYTNARKQALEEAKDLEGRSGTMDIVDVPESSRVTLPALKRKSKERVANINYSRPLAQVRKLADAFGDINLSYRDVGQRSFDDAYKRLVDEDE